MGAHQHHTAGGAGIDAVAIAIRRDQAGGGRPDRLLDEPVERPAQRHEVGALFLEHLPDRAVLELGMLDAPGIGDALICEPGIQLHQAFDPRLGTEQLIAQIADLILDLALFPT